MDRILAILLVAKLALFASAVGYVEGTGVEAAPERPVPVQDALAEVDEPFPHEDPRLP